MTREKALEIVRNEGFGWNVTTLIWITGDLVAINCQYQDKHNYIIFDVAADAVRYIGRGVVEWREKQCLH